jgi:hypothetical protein
VHHAFGCQQRKKTGTVYPQDHVCQEVEVRSGSQTSFERPL